jgi:Flp pilus assembly protein TadD
MAPDATDLALLPQWLADGQAALEAAQFAEAATAFERAAHALPTEWTLHVMATNAWRLAGRVVAERAAWRWAYHAGRPTTAEALYQLGTGLLESGAPAEARDCFEKVVKQRPRDAAALAALASARRADGDPQGAWPLVQRALTLAHKMPSLLLTAAQVRHALGDTTGARQWLAKAEKVRPGHPLQQIQLAFAHLLDGARAPGWEAFEARGLPERPAHGRDWRGEPLAGQSIAVVMEQGLGDLFHFVRYVRRLEAAGPSRVVVECPPTAVDLLVASGFDAVPTGTLPATDWVVPLLSLPLRLGSDTDTAADLVPYIGTGTASAPIVRPLQVTAAPRVGLVVRGNPAFLATRLRDLDDEHIEQLLAIPDVQWVWLQHGQPVPAAATPALPVELPPLDGDWLQTARLIASLDAVVSVDTAVAHLAGAMGIPVYILVPHAPDWRWGLERTDCAWYPSATLVRQPAPLDWAGAVNTLRRHLAPRQPVG